MDPHLVGNPAGEVAAARLVEEVAGKAEEASQSREGEAAGPTPEEEGEEVTETSRTDQDATVAIKTDWKRAVGSESLPAFANAGQFHLYA